MSTGFVRTEYTVTNDVTTSSKASEFETHLGVLSYDWANTASGLEQRYKNISQQMRATSNAYNPRRFEAPDREALFLGFSAIHGVLKQVVELIKESEERVDFLSEEDVGSEEYQHAMGELFGAKSAYIAMYKSVIPSEIKRLEAVDQGFSQEEYYHESYRGGTGRYRDYMSVPDVYKKFG
jgi:hypothetical protein